MSGNQTQNKITTLDAAISKLRQENDKRLGRLNMSRNKMLNLVNELGKENIAETLKGSEADLTKITKSASQQGLLDKSILIIDRTLMPIQIEMGETIAFAQSELRIAQSLKSPDNKDEFDRCLANIEKYQAKIDSLSEKSNLEMPKVGTVLSEDPSLINLLKQAPQQTTQTPVKQVDDAPPAAHQKPEANKSTPVHAIQNKEQVVQPETTDKQWLIVRIAIAIKTKIIDFIKYFGNSENKTAETNQSSPLTTGDKNSANDTEQSASKTPYLGMKRTLLHSSGTRYEQAKPPSQPPAFGGPPSYEESLEHIKPVNDDQVDKKRILKT